MQREHHGASGAALVELSDFVLAEPFGRAVLADIADAEHVSRLVLVHLERVLPGIALLRGKLLQLPALKLEERRDADVAVRIPAIIRPRIERIRRAAVRARAAVRVAGIARRRTRVHLVLYRAVVVKTRRILRPLSAAPHKRQQRRSRRRDKCRARKYRLPHHCSFPVL